MNERVLSKRERQIMDVLFQLQSGSAADVLAELPDPPSYTAVRTMLRLLEKKGLVEHRQEGRRYIYKPRRSSMTEGRSAISRVLNVFFQGSLEDALAAHLSDPKQRVDEQELRRLRTLIDEAAADSRRQRRALRRRKEE